MSEVVFITPDEPKWPSLNYKQLRAEGISFIQQYSGKNWTDFNLHDPGVTMLEYLCFGITDLGYRCHLPITDFLYATENNRTHLVNNAFFLPEKIFPCAPLTPDDYRRLIIDHLHTVENVWVKPIMEQKNGLEGLYKIQIQLRDEKELPLQSEQIRKDVLTLLTAHRNLCEDFLEIEILKQEPIEIGASIELEPDASCEQVLAQMLLNLIHHFTPPVQIFTYESMLATGASVEAVFDGPEPQFGFIKTETLKPLPVVIYVSQLKDILIGTPGVRSVQNMLVRIKDIQQFSEEIRIPENTFLGLSESMLGQNDKTFPFKFERNGKIIEPVAGLVNQILNSHIARSTRKYNYSLNIPQPSRQSNKDLNEIGAYYSIQRFFPTVYGIGSYGHPLHATPNQKLFAQQLKGYLACLESLLADYLFNLTQLKHLFSIELETEESNQQHEEEDHHPNRSSLEFLQKTLADIPDIQALWNAQTEADSSNHQQAQEKAAIERHHRFTDHLLARFGENFDADNLLKKLDGDKAWQQNQLLKIKQRILREYESLSRNRGVGFNYHAEQQGGIVKEKQIEWNGQQFTTWTCEQVSGLKKRLCFWLNIEDPADRGLTDFQPLNTLFQSWQPDGSTTGPPAQAVPLRPLLKYHRQPEFFVVEKNQPEDAESMGVLFKLNPEKSYLLFNAPDETQALKQLDQLRQALSELNQYSKGFFVVEHLLLRPVSQQGRKLQVTMRIDSNDLTFQTIGYDSMENIEVLADTFLTIASLETNYYILETTDNQYFIVIKKGRQPILVCEETGSFTEVKNWCSRLVALVNETLNTDPAKINDWITLPKQNIQGNNLSAELYNHQLSIILPNWADLFLDEDGRNAFQLLVAQHVPAHLNVMYHWLSWQDMLGFESTYKKWLEAKQPLNSDDLGAGIVLDNLSYALLESLDLADAKKPETDVPDIFAQRKTILDAIFKDSSYDMVFLPDQLTIFQGIDPAIETWLKKANLYNWQLLGAVTPNKLLELYQQANVQGMDLESWIRQARLAAAGDWAELERFQAELADGVVKIKQLADKKLHLLYQL